MILVFLNQIVELLLIGEVQKQFLGFRLGLWAVCMTAGTLLPLFHISGSRAIYLVEYVAIRECDWRGCMEHREDVVDLLLLCRVPLH